MTSDKSREETIASTEHSSVSSNTTTVINPSGMIGQVLDGRYLIERELGKGGIGAVYLAHDRKLHDKRVVVKVLLENSLRDTWVVQKFQQEREALSRVDHPGVVGILDTGELPDQTPYIVMQYVDGVALREVIKAKPDGMELERVASIIKQSGAALDAVHQKKIYHRDLKPENIMLQALGRGDEQVKIVDFGVAKLKGSVIAASTVTGAATAGTIVYMSPEQLRGEKVTAASDIYSLGVIAYEMVTGRRPFNPDTIVHLAEMQRQGVRAKPADLRPRLPEEAQAVMLRALAFDPRERDQNAAEFGDALASALMNDDDLQRSRQVEKRAVLATQPSAERAPSESRAVRQLTPTLVTPFETVRAQTNGSVISTLIATRSGKRSWPMLLAGLAVAVALTVGVYFMIANRLKAESGKPVTQRSIVYSLTVQKMRGGSPYEQPFQSSGQEIFENGYKFRLNLSSTQAGYLYVFNGGGAEQGGLSFSIIFPTPASNMGSAKLEANQTIQTNWNTFAGQTGTEEFWIVWSASPVGELEAARDAAFKNHGELADAAMVRVLMKFLIEHSDPKPETTKDTMRQQTDVRANGDLLVKLVELEHR